MLIALLAILGVDLIVVVALLALVISRKRWVKRQLGAFQGAIRVTGGEIDGLGPKWQRGYGHWVRGVLVWTKAPMLFRNDLMPVDGVDEPQAAGPNEVKRLGDHPVVVRVETGDSTAEIAVRGEDSELALGLRNRFVQRGWMCTARVARTMRGNTIEGERCSCTIQRSPR